MRLIVLAAALLVSGCSLLHEEAATAPACPQVGFVAGASTLTAGAPENLEAEAIIDGFSGDCNYKSDRVVVTIELPFVVRRGPAGGAANGMDLPYFIAVLSPEEEILQRQALTTHAVFDASGVGSVTEEHEINIPLPREAAAYKYKIAIGFSKEKM